MSDKETLNPHVDPTDRGLSNPDIDKILRGEISATEAYDQVISKVKGGPEAQRLRTMRDDHRNAVDFWKRQARYQGNIPEKDSSVWGNVVEAFVGTSKALGNKPALKALKNGEEHGLKLYEKMLDSTRIPPTLKNKIKYTFIPAQKEHITRIEALEEVR